MKHKNTLIYLITATFISICGYLNAAEVNISEKQIDLDLWDKNLEEAIIQLTSRSGIDFTVATDVSRPENFKNIKLYAQARNITVLEAAEWVSRSIGTRYRITDNGTTIEFTSSYQWLDNIPATSSFYNTGGLLDWRDKDRFLNNIRELLKVYAIKEPEYTIRLRNDDQRLFAYLPRILQERVITILRAMGSKGEAPRKNEVNAIYTKELENKLNNPVVFDYNDTPLQVIIADLAFQANVNIGITTESIIKDINRKITIKKENCSLDEALKYLCTKISFAGISYDPPHSLWLTKSTADVGRIVGSRMILWENVPIQSYHVGNVVTDKNSDKILKLIKKSISEDSLVDPSVSVIYHKHSGNIIAIAPINEQIKIENCLYKIINQETK